MHIYIYIHIYIHIYTFRRFERGGPAPPVAASRAVIVERFSA